jgi:ribosomal protein S18 acetylase RimI-like enzyme
MIFRRATADDAPRIASVHVMSWLETYRGIVPDSFLSGLSVERRSAFWHELLSQPQRSSHVFVVEDGGGGGMVAFSSCGNAREWNDDVGAGEFYAIYVLRSARRRRIGTNLMSLMAQALVKDAALRAVVWTLGANAQARAFYERLDGQVWAHGTGLYDGVELPRVAYGWDRLEGLAALSARRLE